MALPYQCSPLTPQEIDQRMLADWQAPENPHLTAFLTRCGLQQQQAQFAADEGHKRLHPLSPSWGSVPPKGKE